MIILKNYLPEPIVMKLGETQFFKRRLFLQSLFVLAFLLINQSVHAGAVNWVGTTSNDWNTDANWDTGKAPKAGDDVYIAISTSYTNYYQPVIASTTNVDIKSLTLGVVQTTRAYQSYSVFGTIFYNFYLTVNGTLKVNGNITMRTNFSGTGVNYVPEILGSGNITANNFIIGDPSYQSYMTNDAQHYAGLYLNLNGTIDLGNGTFQLIGVSNSDVAPAAGPAAVYVASATIKCSAVTTNTNNASTYFFLDVTSFSGFIGSNVTSTGTLVVTSATPFPSPTNTPNKCYFNFGSTSAGSQTTVQFIPSAATQIIPNNLVTYNPYAPNSLASYDNVIISPTGGTHTVSTNSSNTLTILDNFTTSTANTTVDYTGYNSPLSVGGILTNGSGVTMKQGTGSTTVTGAVNNAGTLTLGSGTVTFKSTLTNTGTMTGSGTTTVSGAVTSSKPITFGAGNVTLASTTTNSSTITAGAGNITFGSDFTNNSGGTLTGSTGALYFNGNYTNAAGATITLGTGTVYFNGTGSQTITDNSTGGTNFTNVSFTSGSTATTKTLAGTNDFTVAPTGMLSIVGSNTTLATAGLLTLQSTSSGSASVGTISSGSSITGNVNVQIYFNKQNTAGNKADYTRNYRLLSSPVNVNSVINDASSSAYYTLAYLNTNTGNKTGIFTAGPGGSTNGFTVANATPTIYLYKESLPASNSSFNSGNFKGITNITGNPLTVYNDAGTIANVSATMYAGNGYMLYYVGSNTSNTNSANPNAGGYNKATRVGNSYANVDASTATAVGTLNQGSIPVKMWWNNSTTLTDVKTGYNLVGNPYASSIDWDKLSTTDPTAGIYGPNVSSTIYVFNYASKNYGTYAKGTGGTGTNNATHIIAAGQGFFAQVTSTSGSTLTFNEAAKTSAEPTGSAHLMAVRAQESNAPMQIMRIKLSKDSINTDEAMIVFDKGSSNNYEPFTDAQRLNGIGNITSLATYAKGSNVPLSINRMAAIDSATRIKLYVNISSASDVDTLITSGISSLDSRYDVYLMDHYKKDSLWLNQYPQYLFNINLADTTSFGSNRFEVVFHKKADYSNFHLLSFAGTPGSGSAQINWKTDHEGDFTGFTLQRQDASGQYTTVSQLQGNSGGNYSYTDKSAVKGANHYRLQITDAFGCTSYSSVVTVVLGDNAAAGTEGIMVSVYPNPAASSIKVSVDEQQSQQLLTTTALNAGSNVSSGALQVNILSMSGQVVSRFMGASTTVASGDISGLRPGTYILEASDSQGKKVYGRKRFVKL